jgi:hypothetical protein
MEPDAQFVSVEELLVKADFLSADDLAEAQEIARNSGQQIWRVLIMSGFVTERQLQASAVVHEQLNNGSINMNDAIRTLRDSVESS